MATCAVNNHILGSIFVLFWNTISNQHSRISYGDQNEQDKLKDHLIVLEQNKRIPFSAGA